jgi:hypothetical protein
MTRDDIIRMAREAGLTLGYSFAWDNLERFAALVAAATRESVKADGWRACAVGQRETQHCGLLETAILVEREACARVCDDYAGSNSSPANFSERCAAAIRERGEK